MKGLTGLFLGAGASYEAGMPLAWELTAELKNWLTADRIRELNAGWRTQPGGCSDAVIDDFISMLERPAVHYEALLGYLETQFRRQGNLGQEYHGLYSRLVELVYYFLYFRQVNNNAFLRKRLPFYDGIRALAEANKPLWIFSLNHDVVIEALAALLSIPLHTGFSPATITLPCRDHSGKKKGEIRGAILTKNDLEHGAIYFPNPPQPGIYLLKIHGALDVFTFNNGDDLLKLCPSETSMESIVDVLRAANEELFYLAQGIPGGKIRATNEITYADDQGGMQFLRRSLLAGAYKFDDRATQVLPKSMLKHFRGNLNFISTLICIGYSFGDFHINAALRKWLEFSPERRLEIVSPNSHDVPRFLLHLSPQIVVTRDSATDYLDSRAGFVRSSREMLDKRLFSVLRPLGKERVAEGLASFVKKDRKSLSRAFLAKLRNLALGNGQGELTAMVDSTAVARQWAADMKLTEDDFLDQLIRHFESQSK
jgi:hypothetical protein